MNSLSKDAVSWVTVDDSAAGQRIDNFLCRVLKGVPKSHVYRILRSGEVRVNKGRAGPDRRLEIGDVVRVGGFLVNPLEIEEVVVQFPEVAACQIVEVATPQGSRPVGFVVGHAEYRHQEAELIAHCRSKLAV